MGPKVSEIWSELHKTYKEQDWIDKPSIFAEQAIKYFPKQGKVLELGAGQAQDSCFFATRGFEVTATDIEESALELAKQKAAEKSVTVKFKNVDLREELPFERENFDVVYAHLSLHYFDKETTLRLFGEIQRVLKKGGVFAFFVNSINDPEYKTGKELEPDYFQIDKTAKRYFSEYTARDFAQWFDINLLDEFGETYKDSAKGVHNLVRFIGRKPLNPSPYKSAIPYVGAIIERDHNGSTEVMIQTRWKPHSDQLYSGTLEFPAGALDKPFEFVYDTIAREIKEESGLTLKSIRGDSKTKIYSPKGSDEIIGFRPFCCTQQLKDGKPWIGFVFICEVEDGEPKAQLSEAKDAKWLPAKEVKELFEKSPEQFFGLELPAWEFYLNENK
jgi:ubiquinone/menaquinone biosynthesis C-methylase UbiE/ADP-ribose pyrophosphatase YjhB (NUDIX family)